MAPLGLKGFEFVTIYCKDLQASKRFYVDLLGFRIIREVDNDFFQIDIAGVPVCIDLDPKHAHRNNIAVEVEDLDQAVAALREKGLEPSRGAGQASHEQWVEIEDPDGNHVIFLVHTPVLTQV
jgi:catechol 2,3-dioxygenase-like lactoylglutathione lyase family enzyme